MWRVTVRFNDFLAILDDKEFEEIPVDIDTFVSSDKFLGQLKFRLSPIQKECVLKSTQIYKKETLYSYLSEVEAQQRWGETMNEVILKLGKGSGKDWMIAVSVAYVVYLLLCLKDPSAYYGNSSGDRIDIINIAINAQQASNVFFANVSKLITHCPWFEGKYDAKPGGEPMKSNEINFIKFINVYSGHSEREGWEGYNVFMAILDEIAGFAIESASSQGKTAQAIYDMYRASVKSRYAEFGKYISMSFPRFKGDFITQRYDKVVAIKQVVKRREIMKIDPELPDGIESNEIPIEWDEDHIDAYNFPRTYALCRPPWDVNPTKTLQMYVSEFVENYTDALARFACMPPEAIDAFFKDRTRIEESFSHPNGWTHNEEGGEYRWDFKPQEKMYFVHVDLAQKHDRAAVAMAHVDKWVTNKDAAGKDKAPAPKVVVDLLRYWIPTRQKEVDFQEIQDFVVDLQKKGFNLKLVTFDQWRSEDMRKYLNSIGIRSDLLSIKKEQYVDFAVVMHDNRLEGPDEKMIRDELLGLRLFPNGKIDHPRQGYKDLSDATCGAIFNAVTRTPRDLTEEVEAVTLASVRKTERNVIEQDRNVIKAPSVKERMPPEIAAYLESIKVV
jgi:phage terminase large subunit-like protein